MQPIVALVPSFIVLAADQSSSKLVPPATEVLDPTFPPIIVEDFESYKTTLDVAGPWYKAPHGNQLEQSLDRRNVGGGKQALKIKYKIEDKPGLHYVGICRVKNWDLAGANAFRFWLKPDGSGRHFGIQFNLSDERGANIHDLWDTKYVPEKGDRSPRWVIVPFKSLKQDTRFASGVVAKEFKPQSVCEIAFYVATQKGYFGSGAYTVDELQAVRILD